MKSRRLLVAGAAVAAIGVARLAARRPPAGAGRRLSDARASLARTSMPGARTYDLSARLLGPIYDRVARQIAAEAPPRADVLDVGCGPGHLALRLARQAPSLRVTGVDVDPAMVERAVANADRAFGQTVGRPEFAVGDVAALPFLDGSFDMVVSTFSLHHWEDPAAGLGDLHRVLRPGGRALIWDLVGPLRRHSVSGSGLVDVAAASPFRRATIAGRWGLGPLVLAERYDLERPSPADRDAGLPEDRKLESGWSIEPV